MKKILMITGVLLLGALSYGWYLYSKPTEKTIRADADFSINARTLFAEFQNSEAEANAKYLNKVLNVNGRISSVEKSDSLGLNITLDAGDELGGVNCQVPEPEEGLLLSDGDSVSLKGLCTGVLMDVIISRCSLEKK